MKINESESQEIIKRVNTIIDRHAEQDFELMRKLEDFAFDMLIITEQELIEEMAPDFLHHLFIRSRIFTSPARKEDRKKYLKKWLANKKVAHG